MQGVRTYLIAMLMAALPALTEWLGGVDWVAVLTQLGVPQQWVIPISMALAAAIMAFMRSITTTPPWVKE